MDHHHMLDIMALLGTALIIAKLLGGVSEKIGVPSVLAELVTGIILGNLWGSLGSAFGSVDESEIVKGLSEMGVLFLLFLVGLETDLKEIGKVGLDAVWAALLGIVAPFALAFGTLPLLFPALDFNHTLFIAAALTATSVGITARVLQDAGQLKSVSGQVILGAAVIDDILGVVVLTIVTALVTQGGVSAANIGILFLKIAGFGVGIVFLRKFFMARVIRSFRALDISGTVTIFCLSMVMCFAWIADRIGLAGIIGAFALGIILDDVQFKRFYDTRQHGLEEVLKPIIDFFAPIFFVVIGMGVNLKELANPSSLGLGLLLTGCAIIGKLVCGLGLRSETRGRGGDRILVGVGMVPRGEVGLIFAALGLNNGILKQADYAAVVMMCAITTLLAPGLISWRCKQLASRQIATTSSTDAA